MNQEPNTTGLTMGHSTFIPNDDDARGASGSGRAFFFGFLLGVLATLVLAPKTGEETREQIKEWTILLTERLRGMMTGERPDDMDDMDDMDDTALPSL
jgi:hypothetical protein